MKSSLTPRRLKGFRALQKTPESQLPSSEGGLSEDVIKKVALRFMRQYYKFRLRYDDQPVVAKYDLEGVGGIVADGYYSFKKTDGKSFVATFEATSKAKKDEVLFKPQNQILFWDGFAMASLAAVIFSSINYFYNFHQISEREFFIRAGMILGVMALSFTLFYLIARNFRRYRYIYAVEQFKRYHAEEQWIAIASDVFSVSDSDSERFAKKQDRRFRELKEQCVLNGFGLLKVDTNLDTKIVVTPSRQDIFLGKRKRVKFMSSDKVNRAKVDQEFGLKGIIKQLIPGLSKSNPDNVYRFRKKFYNQMLLALGSFLLIGFMLVKEMSLSDFQEVDQQSFRNEFGISQSNNVLEQNEVLGDSSITTNTNRIEQEEFNRQLWTPEKKAEAPKETPTKTKPPTTTLPEQPISSNNKNQIYINDGKSDEPIAYDCTRFFNFESRKYIVVEGTYPDWETTKMRLDILRDNKIESASLLLPCFSRNETGYVIYIGEIYNSMEEASKKIERFRGVSRSILKDVNDLKIRSIYPVRR